MSILFWTVFIIIIIIVIMFIYFFYNLSNFGMYQENWQDYMRTPFDFVSTGSNPINFYRKDLYREPYDYPYKFYQSYPVPSMQYHTLL